MDNGYVLLVEKEEMWAQMLMQVLENNNVPYAVLPVYGAGLVLRTGTRERLKVYVSSEYLPQATALVDELFSAESIQEDE